MRSSAIIALAWVCATALSAAAQTYNGNLALVQPVQGIRVDGDLSEWPSDMNTYPVLLAESGVESKDELLGGTVEAQSEVGKGTAFIMRLKDCEG